MYSQAACTYRGRLFVIGAALLEPNNRLFRATAMEVPEYSGDIPCDEEPEPEPDPKPDPQPEPAPTPDSNKDSRARPASASTSADGTTTATKTRTLPHTGDETVPPLAVFLAGFVAIAAGILKSRGTSM